MAKPPIDGDGADKAEVDGAPVIDLNEASLKRLIAKAKKRGWLTYEELNAALPQDQMSSEQIEDIMSAISDMGINIVESDEDVQEEAEQEVDDEVDVSAGQRRTVGLIEGVGRRAGIGDDVQRAALLVGRQFFDQGWRRFDC